MFAQIQGAPHKMKNKNANIPLSVIIELLMSALVIVGFVLAGKAYANGEIYYKLSVARDVGLIIETMQSLPGDIEIDYPADLSRFGIKITGNEISVFKVKEESDPTSASFKFVEMEGVKVTGEVYNIKSLRIIKSKKDISLLSTQ